MADNLSNVSFDINDPFANPEEYEEANPYSLGILGLAASIAAGPFSPIVWGIRGLQAYNFAKSQGWLGEEEPQYTGPVNPQTHEIDVINLTEPEMGLGAFMANNPISNPGKGAEGELSISPFDVQTIAMLSGVDVESGGAAPPGPPTANPGTPAEFGGAGPPSGTSSGGGGGGGAADAPSGDPGGGEGPSPWNTGGFVVKPLYDS